MATYFKDEYQEYYDRLKDSHGMRVESLNISNMIDEIKMQYGTAYELIDELQGDFGGELAASIDGLKDELDGTSYILDMLDVALIAMDDLGDDVVSLHDEDPKYEEKQDQYDNKKANFPKSSQYEKGVNSDEYVKDSANWKYNLEIIKVALERLIAVCEQLQGNCDAEIEVIDEFNNAVIDLRLKLAAFAAVGGEMQIKDLDSMTLEEKEAYLAEILESLKNKYRAYQDLYEAAINGLCDSDGASMVLYAMVDYLKYAMPEINIADYLAIFDGNNYTMVERGACLVSFIESMSSKYVEGTDISYMECFTSYLSGKKSFKESGMSILVEKADLGGAGIFNESVANEYRIKYENGEITEEQFLNYLEDKFVSGVQSYSGLDLNDSKTREKVFNYIEKMKSAEVEFIDNYRKQVNTGVIIKGTDNLMNSLKFDDVRLNDPAYDDYSFSYETFDFSYIKEGDRGDSKSYVLEHMKFGYKYTKNEQKMIGYLYSIGEYDKAAEYCKLVDNGMKMREGTIAAEEKYQEILNGASNVTINGAGDVDSDYSAAFYEGVEQGYIGVMDGVSKIFDPNQEPTENDYYQIELARLIQQNVYTIGDGYQKYSPDQVSDYIVDKGYDPYSPSEITISGKGKSTTITYTGESAWVDISGNVVEDLSGYKYDEQSNTYISLDGREALTSVPTFTDGENTMTISGWSAEGYDKVTGRTYGTGDDAFTVSVDEQSTKYISQNMSIGNTVGKYGTQFIIDKIIPGAGKATSIASRYGHAMYDPMVDKSIKYYDPANGMNIDNSGNTPSNARSEYIGTGANGVRVAGDFLKYVGKSLPGTSIGNYVGAVGKYATYAYQAYNGAEKAGDFIFDAFKPSNPEETLYEIKYGDSSNTNALIESWVSL